MKKITIPLFTLLITAVSCNESTDKQEKETKQEIEITEVTEVTEEAVEEEVIPQLAIEPITNTSSPYDSEWNASFKKLVDIHETIEILYPGDYSSGEIDSAILDQNWIGLTRSGNYINFGKALIQLSPIEDPWGEEGNLDGTKVFNSSGKPAFMYLSGINDIDGINMEDIISSQPFSELLPGEVFNFGSFTLSATGNYDEENNQYSNYKLTLSGMKDSFHIEQEILFQEFFDDAMINFYWIGDLDQDGLPDMLIDTSHKYSYSNPTLFLSSQSHQNTLVKKVAETTRYGC
jgi:hypothetical protein